MADFVLSSSQWLFVSGILNKCSQYQCASLLTYCRRTFYLIITRISQRFSDFSPIGGNFNRCTLTHQAKLKIANSIHYNKV